LPDWKDRGQIGGSGAPLGLGLMVNVVTPAGELIVDGRTSVIVSGLRSRAWCFATSSPSPGGDRRCVIFRH
jgi:hypothetical protein